MNKRDIQQTFRDIPAQESASKDDQHQNVKSWSTSVDRIFANSDIRIDAKHFNPETHRAIDSLKLSGVKLSRLDDLASVELHNQFTRIWAQDQNHGLPYLNATDLLSLFAVGKPAGETRYLSRVTETNIERLVIRQGWLLVTCSGTIGRVFVVPQRLDGWVATHDLIRVIPNSNITGYLYAWLQTSLAREQILHHTHGGQIDHITDDQLSELLVPLLPTDEMKAINTAIELAMAARENAISTLMSTWPKN